MPQGRGSDAAHLFTVLWCSGTVLKGVASTFSIHFHGAAATRPPQADVTHNGEAEGSLPPVPSFRKRDIPTPIIATVPGKCNGYVLQYVLRLTSGLTRRSKAEVRVHFPQRSQPPSLGVPARGSENPQSRTDFANASSRITLRELAQVPPATDRGLNCLKAMLE